MTPFTQPIAQRAEDVTVIADPVNMMNVAARRHQPDKLQQQAFWEQAVTGARRPLNYVMRDIAARPLQTADGQLPLLLLAGDAKGRAGQHGLIAIAQP